MLSLTRHSAPNQETIFFFQTSWTGVIQELTTFEIIDNNFYDVLREILSICNYAIHGKTVTSKQVHFVIKNAKPVLDYLSKVK